MWKPSSFCLDMPNSIMLVRINRFRQEGSKRCSQGFFSRTPPQGNMSSTTAGPTLQFLWRSPVNFDGLAYNSIIKLQIRNLCCEKLEPNRYALRIEEESHGDD
jgi:hypothetical protein